MKSLMLLGGMAVVIVVVLVAVILVEMPDPIQVRTPENPDGWQQQEIVSDNHNSQNIHGQVIRAQLSDEMMDEERDTELAPGAYNRTEILRFGQEFEEKWAQDRERLGEVLHGEMEKLWFEGRRPRGAKESIEKLEKLLNDFPNTNRAGCAAWELGHHYLRSRDLTLEERRKKAEQVWLLAEQRYSDSLCEYNSHAAAMSKLALSNWVYRYTDPIMAKRVLEEIIEKHSGENDHLGQPLDVVAKRILDQLNATPK